MKTENSCEFVDLYIVVYILDEIKFSFTEFSFTEHMHEILQSCNHHENVSHFNIEQAKLELNPNFSIFFNNIDGNLSNFDALSVVLKKYKSKLAVIALCETNINENHKDLYQLEGYEPSHTLYASQ